MISLAGVFFLSVVVGGIVGAVDSNDSLLPGWAEGGIAIAAIIAFLTDRVKTGSDYKQVLKERDEERARTEAAEAAAKSVLIDKVFPALTDTQLALQNVNDVVIPELRSIVDRLDALDRKAG